MSWRVKLGLLLVSGFIVIVVGFLSVTNTSPVEAQSASFSFGAAGDFWTQAEFQATVDEVARQNPAFMLALGDFSYTPGYEEQWCNAWKAKYNNVLLIVGNHDTGENPGGYIDNYVQHCPFTLGQMTGVYGHQYYFDYPADNPLARFILIRPGIYGTNPISYNAGKPGYNFTQSAIDGARAQGIPWVVVGFHKNYISTLEKSNEIGTDLMKLLLDKKVDLILQGHEHSYERSKQLTTSSTCPILPTNTFDSDCVVDADNDLVKGAGTVIHVIGTGGITLRTINPNDPENPYFAIADNTTFGFGQFTVTDNQLGFNFIRSAGGNLSDAFTITALPSPTPQPSSTPTPTRTPTPIRTPTPTPTLVATPTPTPAGTISLLPTDDTFVASDSASRNYGKNANILVDGSPQKIIYIKFDLRSLTSNRITSAKLKLKVTNASTQTQTIQHVTTDTWKETQVTYQNRPALGSVITSIKGGAVDQVLEIDLTQAVKSKTGSFFPLAITMTGANDLRFNSKEALTHKPMLVVR